MNAKKKLISLGLAGSLAAIAVVGSSLAYFTDKDTKDNVYSIGNVDIQLVEPTWGTEEADNLYPGEAVKKDPIVVNSGKNPAFVRVKVTGAENFTFRTDWKDGISADWKLHEDGWYYYHKDGNGVLQSDTATDALFDQIVLKEEVKNGSGDANKIIVEAEAVQAQGAKTKFTDVEKMTVEEIAAWFDTCMK